MLAALTEMYASQQLQLGVCGLSSRFLFSVQCLPGISCLAIGVSCIAVILCGVLSVLSACVLVLRQVGVVFGLAAGN